MKLRYLVGALAVFVIITISSCEKEDLFEQPTIEVTGYSLLELPGEYTYLEIDMIVTNNDTREVHIADVEYQVDIEGYISEKENYDIDQEILVDKPLELTLPLTLVTNDAIQLLTRLDAGEELDFIVTGEFHVDDRILKRFDLPINIEGTAQIDAGFEDFYEQPEVSVIEMSNTYTINGLSSYTFNIDVNCTVENKDSRDVVVDEVEYVVFIEGVESETHLYSASYSADISIAGAATISLALPVTINLGIMDGATLAAAMVSGTVNYTIEGAFHAIEVDGAAADFILPLYESGSVPSTMVNK